MKLLITGGHLTPAIAVIEKLVKENNVEIIFIGRKVTREGSKILSREMKEIPKLGVKFFALDAGKLPRHINLRSITAISKIPIGFFMALWYLRRFRPDVILSFGGYIAAPIALAGKIMKIPIITHEQTTAKGLTNEFIERLATKVAVSWKESAAQFKKEIVVTGNPVREVIINGPGKKVPVYLNELDMIYITGGNQGSHIINKTVANSLIQLTKRFSIVHQCGIGKSGRDLAMLLEVKDGLANKYKKRYLVREWFDDSEVAWLLRNAELVISRSGANIVTELALVGTKALLIPLPIASRNEQFKNALVLKEAGTAEILNQDELTVPRLLKTIKKMQDNQSWYKGNVKKVRSLVNPHAADELIKLVKHVYEKTKESSQESKKNLIN